MKISRHRWAVPVFLLVLSAISYFSVKAIYRHIDRELGVRLSQIHFSELDRQAKSIKGAIELATITVGMVSPQRPKAGWNNVQSELTDIDRDIRVFDTVHQRFPVDFAELMQVRFPRERKDQIERYSKECRIIPLGKRSCILNCDSWEPPASKDLRALVQSFDLRADRFYKLDGHVLLYLPPPSIPATTH